MKHNNNQLPPAIDRQAFENLKDDTAGVVHNVIKTLNLAVDYAEKEQFQSVSNTVTAALRWVYHDITTRGNELLGYTNHQGDTSTHTNPLPQPIADGQDDQPSDPSQSQDKGDQQGGDNG